MCQYEPQSHSLSDWNKKTSKKGDVLHLERVEDESGPGCCLRIQWLCANDTGYASLGCTVQHVFIRCWEVPLIQECTKSHLENTTHSPSDVCTRKRHQICCFTHWKSWEKATIRRRIMKNLFSWQCATFNPQNSPGGDRTTFSKYTWEVKTRKGRE